MNFGTEIFCETLCKFTERKVRSSSEGERIVLQGSAMKAIDLYENILAKLHNPESVLHKIYKYVICKKAFLWLVPVGLFLLSLSGLHINWMSLDSAYCLIWAIFYSFLIIINPCNDWVYIWRLKLYLWFLKIPRHSNLMANPRCITIYLDMHQIPTGQEQRWMIRKVFEKTENELGIYDIGELKSTLQGIQAISPSKQSAIFKFMIKRCFYLLIFLSVFGILCFNFPKMRPLTVFGLFSFVVFHSLEHACVIFYEKSPIRVLLLFVVFGIPLLSVLLCYCTIDLFMLILLMFIAGVYSMIPVPERYLLSHHMSFQINNNKVSDEEIEICFETIDVIFRVHRALKNESIYFTVVTDDFNVLTQIPAEYQRYFKFVIVAKNNIVLPEIYDYSFDLSEISKIDHPPVPMFPTAEINLTNWVEASLQCVNENTSQFVENGLNFLSLLIKINNGVLSNYVILSVVRPQLTKLASNLRGEMSLQNTGDFNRVKEFIGYSKKFGIIRTSQECALDFNEQENYLSRN